MTRQPESDRPVYAFVSCSLQQAPQLIGLTEDFVRRAVRSGDLLAHYAGATGKRIVLRAADIDDWILRMPTERPIDALRRGWR